MQSPQTTCIKKKQQRQQNNVVYKQPLDRPRDSRASLVNCDSRRVLRNDYREFPHAITGQRLQNPFMSTLTLPTRLLTAKNCLSHCTKCCLQYALYT